MNNSNNKEYALSSSKNTSTDTNIDTNTNNNPKIIVGQTSSNEIIKTVVIAKNFTKCFGSNSKFYAYLKDDHGNPISNMYLYLNISNKTYRSLTNKNGRASFSFNFKPAKYNVLVYFNPPSNIQLASNYGSGKTYYSSSNYTYSSANCTINILDNKTHFTVANRYVKRNTNFKVGLSDYYNNKLIGEKVIFYVNGKKYKTVTTDKYGFANLLIKLKGGVYKLQYFYNNKYSRLRSNGTVNLHVYSVKTVLTGKNLYYLYGASKYYTAKLTNTKGKPYKNFKVKFSFKSKSYTVKTDKYGIARLKLNLYPGIYNIDVKFSGDKTYGPSKISKTITVNGTYLYGESLRFNPNTYNNYSVKIKDLNKKPIVGEYIYLTYNSKTYKGITNNQGNAVFRLKISDKSLKFYIKYKGKVSPSISVKRYIYTYKKITNNNAIWVWGADMNNLNLKTLKKSNIKNILLHSYAIDVFGIKKVKKFIARSNKYGINVHIWMQCFYNGKWINPLKCGKAYLNKIISKGRYYARIPGVAGIHFDYLRFGGNAYEYKGATAIINSFTKEITEAIIDVNGKLIISAAIMPEKEDIYYYGQDPNTLGKYLDILVPMEYTGNYGQSYKWVGTMTKYFKENSGNARVWVGLQAYKSDNNPQKLSVAKLSKQVNTAYNYGGDGVALFRFGLVNFYKLRTK
ncbi:Ig-like domain-containing protein [uncultured Methanobrevibacter sp.]|uniref:Ig-like domain-containing protein n=1 Tax=uncultured Methanobrevibacter sp. TaxID=253161 RepID=UPI0025E2A18E|nr:Ig-like domain-containing protein [uncultured Methanobrevibacter sp.]